MGVMESVFSSHRLELLRIGWRSPIPPVVVVGRAGAFRRNHRRAQRRLGTARFAERRAFPRLFYTLQDQPADAVARFEHFETAHGKTPLGVEVEIFVPQAQAALGNRSDPPPLAV